jgi:hypothetical protein
VYSSANPQGLRGMDLLDWVNTNPQNPLNLLFRTCVFKCQSSSSQKMDLLGWLKTNLLTFSSRQVYSSSNPLVPRDWICWSEWILSPNLLFRTCVFKCQSSNSQRMDLLECVDTNLLTSLQDMCIQVPILKFPENGFAGVGGY